MRGWLAHLPIRARLTLLFGALASVVLLVTGVVVYTNFGGDLERTTLQRLRTGAVEVRAAMAEGDPTASFRLVSAGVFVQVVLPDGRVFASAPAAPERPFVEAAEALAVRQPLSTRRVVPTRDGPVEADLHVLPTATGTIVVGAPVSESHAPLYRLGVLLAFGGLGLLVVTTGLAWMLAGAALRPIERMRAEAASIPAGERGRRLPVPETRDEVARLGSTLNDLLGRLEEAFERERRFVDDASHELRTPLANLRMEVDLALRRARTPEELEAALRSAAEESERLGRLAEDLLVLARLERGLPVRSEPVDLAEVIGDVVSSFSARAASAGVRVVVAVEDGASATVDADRVRQALGNLLDNAIRYGPAGGEVRVSARSGDGEVELSVEDPGEGFAEGFRERAFEPFARPDAGRGRSGGGTGLGLAIVRAVAEAHGGVAVAENRAEGGARVRLRLPSA